MILSLASPSSPNQSNPAIKLSQEWVSPLVWVFPVSTLFWGRLVG